VCVCARAPLAERGQGEEKEMGREEAHEARAIILPTMLRVSAGSGVGVAAIASLLWTSLGKWKPELHTTPLLFASALLSKERKH